MQELTWLTSDGALATETVLLVPPRGADKHQQRVHRMWCAGWIGCPKHVTVRGSGHLRKLSHDIA